MGQRPAQSLPTPEHDFVDVSLTKRGTAVFKHKGEAAGEEGARTVVVELKDHPVAPLENKTGYPNAFPRPHVKKLFDTARFTVWSYRWNPGEATPMHFHDKDVVVVYMEDTALKSTSPDGKVIINEYKSGQTKFNLRDRTYSELLIRGTGNRRNGGAEVAGHRTACGFSRVHLEVQIRESLWYLPCRECE